MVSEKYLIQAHRISNAVNMIVKQLLYGPRRLTRE